MSMQQLPPGGVWPKSNTNAVLALVLGILSFMGGSILTGIPAWILGKGALRDIDSGLASPADRTIATVGMVLGIVVVVLSVLAFCVVLMFFAGMFTFLAGAPQPTP